MSYDALNYELAIFSAIENGKQPPVPMLDLEQLKMNCVLLEKQILSTLKEYHIQTIDSIVT